MERRKPPRGTAGQNFEKTECFESMVLKHHTLNPFDRKPQGAVATGGQVRLRLTVEDEQAPVELFLRVWNGDERRYPMRPLGSSANTRASMWCSARQGITPAAARA